MALSGRDSIRAAEAQLTRGSETSWPSLYVSASQHDDAHRLHALLAHATSKASPVKGDSLLGVAARFGNLAGIKVLVEAGYDLNETAVCIGGRNGLSPT